MKEFKKYSKTSVPTKRHDEEEVEELYASCAEEIRSNCSSLSTESKSHQLDNGQSALRDMTNSMSDPTHTDANKLFFQADGPGETSMKPKTSVNRAAQTDSSCPVDVMQKLKKFTVAVFVDSFEDYSFSKTLNESLSSSSLNTSHLPTINYNKTVSESDLDEVFLSKNKDTETPMFKATNEYFQYNITAVNELGVEFNQKILVENMNEEEAMSLKEFELNESKSIRLDVQDHQFNTNKLKAAILNDEAFMFNANPNIYVRDVLTSKPPIIPNSASSPLSNQAPQQPPVNISLANQCLSTITECSNETFETCSNQSSNMIRNMNNQNKSGSSDFEEDNVSLDWTDNTRDKLDESDYRNVTIRRKTNSQLNMDELDTITFNEVCSPNKEADYLNNPTSLEHTYLRNQFASNGSGDNVNNNGCVNSTQITDKLFEKFCLLANDEIMNNASLVNTDSLESASLHRRLSADVCDAPHDMILTNKINTKLLNEILSAHVDEPRSSQSSLSMSLRKKSAELKECCSTSTNSSINKCKQLNELIKPTPVLSSSSCSKLSSINKQTILAASDTKHQLKSSSNSTIAYGSLNNLNANISKDTEFPYDEGDDEVFLINEVSQLFCLTLVIK